MNPESHDAPKPRKGRPRQAPRSGRTKAKPSSADSLSFEESLATLDQIVRDLEQGELGLSDSLNRYEEGVMCLKHCFAELEQAERRVELLKNVDEQGKPVTETFEDGELSLDEKAASRGRRRSAKPAKRRGTESRSDDDDGVDGTAGLF